MHFKNLHVLYLYWSNILDVSRESFFQADEHVILVCFLLVGLCMWFLYVYTVYLQNFALKFSIFS